MASRGERFKKAAIKAAKTRENGETAVREAESCSRRRRNEPSGATTHANERVGPDWEGAESRWTGGDRGRGRCSIASARAESRARKLSRR